MSKTYTPGPWKVEHASRQMDFDDTTVCRIGADLFISSAATSHGDALATATLISAAPDLLDALKEMTEYFEFMVNDANFEAYRKAKRALQKAAVCK